MRSKVDHICWIFLVLVTVSQIISEGLLLFFQRLFFFFLKKNECLLACAQLTPVFAYTLVPGLPYGFCTQALTAWLPHRFETKAWNLWTVFLFPLPICDPVPGEQYEYF